MMRSARLFSATLIAALASAALASAAAGENLGQRPEIGRCVVVSKGGEYGGHRCVRAKPGRGKSDWSSGAGAKRGFTGPFSGPVQLETHGATKLTITCSSGTASGEVSGPKSLSVSATVLQGCKAPAARPIEQFCQNTGAANGELRFNAATEELAYISRTKKFQVGLDLKPAAGSALAAFECGGASESLGTGTGTGTPYELQGSVIGQLTGLNFMSSEHSLAYAVKTGAQAPEKFEAGAVDTLTLLAGAPPTAEPATLVARQSITTEEPLEVLVR